MVDPQADGLVLRDRVSSLKGFYTKKLGVWDAVALADAKQYQLDVEKSKQEHR